MRHLRALVLVVVLAACGGDEGGAIGPQTNTCSGTCLVVDNQSPTLAVHIVKYSACSDPNWGADRLPRFEELRPGAMRGWAVQPGCWDMQATATDMSETHTVSSFGLQVATGQSQVLVFNLP